MKRKTSVVPVRCVDFSNSSQVVSFFSRDFGLIEGLAKGAHREKNAFQGPFDLAVLYDLVFLERAAGGLAVLTEACVLHGFRGLRRDWSRHVAASHVIEFVRAVATAGDPAPELFDHVIETLGALEHAKDRQVDLRLLEFDLRALRILGLLAPPVACVRCHRTWSGADRPVFFSSRAGGLVCPRCRARQDDLPGRMLPGHTVQALRTLSGDLVSQPHEVAARAERDSRALQPVVAELRTNLLEREFILLKCSPRWL